MVLKHVLSIDIEPWGRDVNRSNIVSVDRILNMLDEYGVKTSFFVLGKVYDEYPEIIYEIRERGHEICYHTYSHPFLSDRETLLDDLKASSRFLAEFKPEGFRAPELFMKESYLKILENFGFKYDSSVYGDFELCKHIGNILEMPVCAYKLLDKKSDLTFPRTLKQSLLAGEIPIGSGYFIGLLRSKTSYFIKKNEKKNKPTILFIHSEQLENSPSLTQFFNAFPSLIKNLPYYFNCFKIFKHLLGSHKFYTLKELAEDVKANVFG